MGPKQENDPESQEEVDELLWAASPCQWTPRAPSKDARQVAP